MSGFWRSAAYTKRQWFWAVTWSAASVWFLFTIGLLWVYRSEDLSQFSLEAILKAAVFLAVFFFLSAFSLSWIVIAPLLTLLMRRPVSWIGAPVYGGVLGMVLYITLLLCIFLIAPLLGRSLDFNLWELPFGLIHFGFGGIIVSVVVRGYLGPGLVHGSVKG